MKTLIDLIEALVNFDEKNKSNNSRICGIACPYGEQLTCTGCPLLILRDNKEHLPEWIAKLRTIETLTK